MGEYVVIAGLSGAGRTEVSRTLEDLGWFSIDNLPPALIPKVAELAGAPDARIERIALAVAAGRHDTEILPAIDELRRRGDRVRMVFLDASTEQLIRRYESTRRRHPYSAELTVAESIEAERDVLEPLKEAADVVIDTTELNVHQLRARVVDVFDQDGLSLPMHLRVMSFGYKHGLPLDVDVAIDCRFLPNPHWVAELRPLSGRDPAVVRHVLDQPVTAPFLAHLESLLALLLPQYVAEGKAYLAMAFGCTGGRHRSVVIAEEVAARLRRSGYEPTVTHRDIDR